MDALIRAGRRGDREANDLLIFGDLEWRQWPGVIPAAISGRNFLVHGNMPHSRRRVMRLSSS